VSRRERAAATVLLLPTLVLAVLFAAAIVLERTAPQVDNAEFLLEDLPPVTFDPEPSCTRDRRLDLDDERRSDVVPGGRVSSAGLVACPQAFDQASVTYVGEVVGHLMDRAEGAWVQVNDDAYALQHGPLPAHDVSAGVNSGVTVWLPTELHERLTGLGGPERRGDVVLVTGTVNRTDPADGGGMTIRAAELEILAESTPLEAETHVVQAGVAVLAAAAAGAATLWARRARNR
jgi:hypothetical protein